MLFRFHKIILIFKIILYNFQKMLTFYTPKIPSKLTLLDNYYFVI